MTMIAHVDMHFIAHMQLQGQMTSLPDSLPLSSEGLNTPPPPTAPPGVQVSEAKLDLGPGSWGGKAGFGGVTLGGPWAHPTPDNRPVCSQIGVL